MDSHSKRYLVWFNDTHEVVAEADSSGEAQELQERHTKRLEDEGLNVRLEAVRNPDLSPQTSVG